MDFGIQFRKILFLILQVFVLQAKAQLSDSSGVANDSQTKAEKSILNVPFYPNGHSNTFGIKARFLPWTIGNMGGLNVSLGLEQSFFKTHSFTLEGYYYGFQDHHDNYHGPNNPNNTESDHHYKLNLAMVVEYRYYRTTIAKKVSAHPYFGLTSRIGKIKETWDMALENENTYQLRHYSAGGPIVGLVLKPLSRKRLSVDLNAGMRYTSQKISNMFPLNLGEENSWNKLTSFNLHLSIYLGWYFNT